MQATVQPYLAQQHARVPRLQIQDIHESKFVIHMADNASKPLKIQSKTKSDDVREAAGFTPVGWQVFLVRKNESTYSDSKTNEVWTETF